jgi:hypothetical protein
VTLGPVVTSSGLTENEVIGTEKLTEWSGTDGVHGTGFQVHKDSTRNITSTSSFVEVDIDTFQLEIGISVIGTSGINSVFISDDFPEFGTDLVTTLSSLDMN